MATAQSSNLATALDRTDEHSTTALYRAAIGGISNSYYLPRFIRYEAADRPGLSWNWAAAFATLNWLMFRQMWQAALLYSGSVVAIALIGLGIGKLVFQFSDGLQWGLLAAILGLTVLVPGLGGNALYFLATRERVQKALTKHPSVAEACIDLNEKASTRRGLILIAAGNVTLLAIAAQSYAMFTGFEPIPFGSPVAQQTGAAPSLVSVAPASPPSSTASAPGHLQNSPEARNVVMGKIEAADTTAKNSVAVAPSAAPMVSASGASGSVNPSTSAPAAGAPAAPPVKAPEPSAVKVDPPALPALNPSAPKAATPDTSKASAAVPKNSSPAPVPMRSAAAEAAAREVAAASAVPAPQPPVEKTANKPPRAESSNRFVVNVGLFSDANAARNALVKLTDAELPVIRKEVRASNGNRILLQVGPFETVTEADAAADKMRGLGVEGRVAISP